MLVNPLKVWRNIFSLFLYLFLALFHYSFLSESLSKRCIYNTPPSLPVAIFSYFANLDPLTTKLTVCPWTRTHPPSLSLSHCYCSLSLFLFLFSLSHYFYLSISVFPEREYVSGWLEVKIYTSCETNASFLLSFFSLSFANQVETFGQSLLPRIRQKRYSSSQMSNTLQTCMGMKLLEENCWFI